MFVLRAPRVSITVKFGRCIPNLVLLAPVTGLVHLGLPGLICLHPLPGLLPLAHLGLAVVIILLATTALVLCPVIAGATVPPVHPLQHAHGQLAVQPYWKKNLH